MQQTFPVGSISQDPFEFIVSSSNELAHNTILSWPKNWGIQPYPNALILKGGISSGKTMLAKILANKNNALFIKKHHKLTENIVDHHQLFIIDSFDESWDKQEVLHYFNIIHESNKYLLLVMRNMPTITLPDLASRLNSVNKVEILMPDDELMKILIFKLFSNYSLSVQNEVINYLVKVLPREFPKIITAIEKINIYSLQDKRKITVPFVKNLLC